MAEAPAVGSWGAVRRSRPRPLPRRRAPPNPAMAGSSRDGSSRCRRRHHSRASSTNRPSRDRRAAFDAAYCRMARAPASAQRQTVDGSQPKTWYEARPWRTHAVDPSPVYHSCSRCRAPWAATWRGLGTTHWKKPALPPRRPVTRPRPLTTRRAPPRRWLQADASCPGSNHLRRWRHRQQAALQTQTARSTFRRVQFSLAEPRPHRGCSWNVLSMTPLVRAA
jgi:hypothetical protein